MTDSDTCAGTAEEFVKIARLIFIAWKDIRNLLQ